MEYAIARHCRTDVSTSRVYHAPENSRVLTARPRGRKQRENPRIIIAAAEMKLQRERKEREARRTPRQIIEEAEARLAVRGQTPERPEHVGWWDCHRDHEIDPYIRRPDGFREKESARQREEDMELKREAASLKARWEALRRASRLRSVIASENEF
jgi:hypothetical protein